ncbi:hypothetical protein ABTP71_18585, partial [Acinetobacter baumannii]
MTALSTFTMLVLHEMRLAWRGFMSLINARSPRRAALILTAIFLGLHLVAWPAARWLTPYLTGPSFSPHLILGLAAAAFFWM